MEVTSCSRLLREGTAGADCSESHHVLTIQGWGVPNLRGQPVPGPGSPHPQPQSSFSKPPRDFLRYRARGKSFERHLTPSGGCKTREVPRDAVSGAGLVQHRLPRQRSGCWWSTGRLSGAAVVQVSGRDYSRGRQMQIQWKPTIVPTPTFLLTKLRI